MDDLLAYCVEQIALDGEQGMCSQHGEELSPFTRQNPMLSCVRSCTGANLAICPRFPRSQSKGWSIRNIRSLISTEAVEAPLKTSRNHCEARRQDNPSQSRFTRSILHPSNPQ